MIDLFNNIKLTESREVVNYVDNCIKSKSNATICYFSFHHVTNSEWNNFLSNFFLNKYFFIGDGVGITFAKQLLSETTKPDNIEVGTDIFYSILEHANKMNWKIFFLGGDDFIIINIKMAIDKKYPNLEFLEFENGFFQFDDERVINKINNFAPDILFVGMGVPRQEKWIYKFRNQINATVVISCGGFLKFLGGITPRAPNWMRKFGFEWLHRMFTDINYFWKRYIFGIPKFLFLIFNAYLMDKFNSE